MNNTHPHNDSNSDTVTISVGQKSHAHNRLHREVESSHEDNDEVSMEIPQWESESDEEAVETDDEENDDATVTPDMLEVIQDGAFMISAETVRAYAIAYKGGYTAFERDFETKWVQQIQNPLGEEIQVKKSEKNKMDVFTQFSHVTLEDFNEVVNLTETERDEYLAEHHMDKDDFKNWELVIKYWEEAEDLAFSNETLVADIAKGAFIAELEKAKVE